MNNKPVLLGDAFLGTCLEYLFLHWNISSVTHQFRLLQHNDPSSKQAPKFSYWKPILSIALLDILYTQPFVLYFLFYIFLQISSYPEENTLSLISVGHA